MRPMPWSALHGIRTGKTSSRLWLICVAMVVSTVLVAVYIVTGSAMDQLCMTSSRHLAPWRFQGLSFSLGPAAGQRFICHRAALPTSWKHEASTVHLGLCAIERRNAGASWGHPYNLAPNPSPNQLGGLLEEAASSSPNSSHNWPGRVTRGGSFE